MRLYKVISGALVFAMVSIVSTRASGGTVYDSHKTARLTGEPRTWKAFASAVTYDPIPQSACAIMNPPQPLATPLPLVDGYIPNKKISVSFVIDTDGLVYSAFVLQSAGPAKDRAVLKTLRAWRYRPALCNGAPTQAEARIEFSTPASNY